MSKSSEASKLWRLKNPEKYRATYNRMNGRGRGYDHNSGALYAEVETEEILATSEGQALGDIALAKKLGRTVASIQAKRVRAKRASGRVASRRNLKRATTKSEVAIAVAGKEEAPNYPVKDSEGRLLIACRELD